MAKTILVTVSADGDVVVETRGFKGRLCAKATEMLEKALGRKVKETKTPEWHQTEDQKETQR